MRWSARRRWRPCLHLSFSLGCHCPLDTASDQPGVLIADVMYRGTPTLSISRSLRPRLPVPAAPLQQGTAPRVLCCTGPPPRLPSSSWRWQCPSQRWTVGFLWAGLVMLMARSCDEKSVDKFRPIKARSRTENAEIGRGPPSKQDHSPRPDHTYPRPRSAGAAGAPGRSPTSLLPSTPTTRPSRTPILYQAQGLWSPVEPCGGTSRTSCVLCAEC